MEVALGGRPTGRANVARRCWRRWRVSCASSVVQRYGGTVGSFTGDGIMAVFGAPAALEDHAVRACLAGLAIQEEAKQLAVDVQDRDGVELWLRVGLNSGQVIAGEIGSGPFGYTPPSVGIRRLHRQLSDDSCAGRAGWIDNRPTTAILPRAWTDDVDG